MNTLIKFGKTLTLLLILAGFMACSDDDNSAPFEVIGDVFVIKRNINNEAKYAVAYAAHGNQPMSIAKVSLPQGTELTLTATDETLRTWEKIPALNEFSSSIPAEANYQFLVVNEDINHQTVDLLEFDNIDTTKYETVEFVNEGLSIKWETNPFGERYRILLINAVGEIAFRSLPLLKQQKQLIFNNPTASGNWFETPAVGQAYTIELLTFRFEDDATTEEYDHHIQEINISSAKIVWQ